MRDPNRTEETVLLEVDESDIEPLAGSGFATEQADPDFDDAAEGREG